MNREELKQIVTINAGAKREGALRTKLEQVRANLERMSREIQQAVEVKHTPWVVLLIRDGEGWKALGCYDSNDLPDDMPEDFDCVLPIPDPSTLPEFTGW